MVVPLRAVATEDPEHLPARMLITFFRVFCLDESQFQDQEGFVALVNEMSQVRAHGVYVSDKLPRVANLSWNMRHDP